MKIIIKNEYKFLIALFIISFSIRLAIAPLFILPPDIPHDFYAYISYGEAIIRGDLYANISVESVNMVMPNSTYQGIGLYGPLEGVMYAPLLILFGKYFLILKFPSIIFDSFNVIIVYYIVKNLRGIAIARYAAILYSFSYLVLLSSAVTGNNDNYELFWLLLAIFLLTKDAPNITLSAISLGIGIGYIFLPGVALLPIVYYFYQIRNLKNGLKYILITFLTLFAILLPFYLKSGINVLFPYIGVWGVPIFNWPASSFSTAVDGMTIPNMIKMLGYYFVYGVDKPYNEYIFPIIISTITTLLGFILLAAYLIKFKLGDKKIELIRNIFLIFFVGVLFVKAFYYLQLLWMLLPILVLITYYHTTPHTKEFELNSQELAGHILVIIGLIVYAAIYREFVPYSTIERILLVLTVIPITIGTYLTLLRTDIKTSWAVVTFVGSLFMIMDARPLTLLSPYLVVFQSTRFSWGIHYFATIVFMIFAMFLLLKRVHTSIQQKSFQKESELT